MIFQTLYLLRERKPRFGVLQCTSQKKISPCLAANGLIVMGQPYANCASRSTDRASGVCIDR